jgi:hypothetical protein
MNKNFDEAYARYQSSLSRLDATNDILEKNVLFRQLTEQLTDLEQRVSRQKSGAETAQFAAEDSEASYWI